MTDPIRDALRAACATDAFWDNGASPAAADIMRDRAEAIQAFLRALPRDWRQIMVHETARRIPAITGWTEDEPRDGIETSAHWHAMRLAAAVEEAARDPR